MTEPTGDGFAKTPPPGQQFNASESEGSLVITLVHKFVPGVVTKFGVRNTVDASIFVLAGPNAGAEYIGCSLFNSKLVGQLMGLEGRYTLGRIAKGQPAKAGQSPPIILLDPSEEDRQVAQRWIANNPGKIERTQAIGKQMAETPKAAPQPVQQYQPGYNPAYGQQPPYPPPGAYQTGGYPQQQQQQFQPPAPQYAQAGPQQHYLPQPAVQAQNEAHPIYQANPGQLPPPPPVTNPDAPPF